MNKLIINKPFVPLQNKPIFRKSCLKRNFVCKNKKNDNDKVVSNIYKRLSENGIDITKIDKEVVEESTKIPENKEEEPEVSKFFNITFKKNKDKNLLEISNKGKDNEENKSNLFQYEEMQKEWDKKIEKGRYIPITAKQAGEMLQNDKSTTVILDIRAGYERDRAALPCSVNIPLFDEPAFFHPLIVLNQFIIFMLHGLWAGGRFVMLNPAFGSEIRSTIGQEKSIIVVCQMGLRSMMACDALFNEGYRKLYFIKDGLDTSQPGDLPSINNVDLRKGSDGGLSSLFGMSRYKQSIEGAKGSFERIMGYMIFALIIDALWYGWTMYDISQKYDLNYLHEKNNEIRSKYEQKKLPLSKKLKSGKSLII